MRALPIAIVALLVLAPIAGVSALSTPQSTDAATIDQRNLGVETAGDVESVDRTAVSTARTASTVASNHTLANRTGNVLSIPAGDVQRSTTDEQYVDLGPAVEFGTNASAAQIETLTVIERIERADSPDVRSTRISEALDTIEQRTGQLREREQRAIEAYGDGDLSPQAFLLELAHIDAQARALEDRRSQLVAIAEDDDEIELDRGRVASLEHRVDALTGPVRAHAGDVLQGRAGIHRFFVATGPESVVLSTITDGTYVREAFRGDRYDSGGGTDIGPADALDIAAESYPLLWELRQNNTDVVGSNGNYLVRMPHQRGVLQAFVDGSSRAVYKEFQTRPLASFERVSTTTATRDGLTLTANYTYPGGPVHLRLVDAETETPVDANVTLSEGDEESELLGRSGDDGSIWTLSPQREYTVTAIRGNDVVVLSIRPAAPPRVGEQQNQSV
jgi:hypothetical protein